MELLADAFNFMEEYEEACEVLEEIIDARKEESGGDIVYDDPSMLQLYRSIASN